MLLTLPATYCLRAQEVRTERDSLVFFELPDEVTDAYLDSADVSKKFKINDYSMIGAEYGAIMIGSTFTPVRDTKTFIRPGQFGVLFTHYSKMFGLYPYFGYQIGVYHGYEGYQFKENEETGLTPTVEGAVKALIEVVEVPFMLHAHMDTYRFKMMANVGLYGGYRLGIERFGDEVPETSRNTFIDTDKRFDYGLKASAGFGLAFDPLEFHLTLQFKYGWNSYYDADYYSPYYYRYAYPFNFALSAGVHFHLTKRSGWSKAQLRKEARRAVYGEE